MTLNVKYIVEGTGSPTIDADNIPVTDAGTYFAGTEVETALQEIGAGTVAFPLVRTPQIKTDTTTPTDLTITTGAAKTLVLATAVYQDCNVGALVLKTGGTLPGTVMIKDNDGDDAGIYTLGFAVDEQGSGVMEIPHDYKEGTDLVFHIHWGANDAPTDTDKVQWQLTYSVSRDNTTFPDSVVIVKETDYDTQYEWLRSDFPTITGTNFKIGDQFHFSIKRIAASSVEFGGEALVASVGFHYQIDTLGSRGVGTK